MAWSSPSLGLDPPAGNAIQRPRSRPGLSRPRDDWPARKHAFLGLPASNSPFSLRLQNHRLLESSLLAVGRGYAILDELKARITEARAQQNPHRQDTRDRASEARCLAQESARAAGEENAVASPDDVSSPPSERLQG